MMRMLLILASDAGTQRRAGCLATLSTAYRSCHAYFEETCNCTTKAFLHEDMLSQSRLSDLHCEGLATTFSSGAAVRCVTSTTATRQLAVHPCCCNRLVQSIGYFPIHAQAGPPSPASDCPTLPQLACRPHLLRNFKGMSLQARCKYAGAPCAAYAAGQRVQQRPAVQPSQAPCQRSGNFPARQQRRSISVLASDAAAATTVAAPPASAVQDSPLVYSGVVFVRNCISC